MPIFGDLISHCTVVCYNYMDFKRGRVINESAFALCLEKSIKKYKIKEKV